MPSLGSAPGLIVAAGVGAAASVALEPAFEVPKQDAWARLPNKILDAGTLAALVAQGGVVLGNPDGGTAGSAYGEARRQGLGADKLDRLVWLAQKAPDLALTLELWRRGQFGDPTKAPAIALVDHALAKEQIEPQYWQPIKELFGERLAPPVIALAIVRGIMKDPGYLPVGPPTAEGKVKAFPVSNIDTLEELRAHGFDFDRGFVETAIAGRPMGPEAAAAATFRKILERVDYDRAIAEGDVRNEWADAIFETARQIPSVADYVNARIRGWITDQEMNAGTARHGMSAEDTHLLYLRTGRPAAPGQMATAAARGIDGPDGVPMNRAQFLKGIAESDIRPEWGPMLWDSRYLYPPLFQLTRLVQAGAIDAATAKDWATKDRYPPEVVDALHSYWLTLTGGAAATVPEVGKARTQLWTAIHRSFIAGEITPDRADNELAALIPDPADRSAVLTLWEQEKNVTIKQLTPSQIKKAYGENALTQDAAVIRLEQQNWTQADALTYLTT